MARTCRSAGDSRGTSQAATRSPERSGSSRTSSHCGKGPPTPISATPASTTFTSVRKLRYRHGDRIYLMDPGDAPFFDAVARHGPEDLPQVPMRYLSTRANHNAFCAERSRVCRYGRRSSRDSLRQTCRRCTNPRGFWRCSNNVDPSRRRDCPRREEQRKVFAKSAKRPRFRGEIFERNDRYQNRRRTFCLVTGMRLPTQSTSSLPLRNMP